MQEPWRMSAWSSGAVASNRGDVCPAKGREKFTDQIQAIKGFRHSILRLM